MQEILAGFRMPVEALTLLKRPIDYYIEINVFLWILF